MSPQYSIGTVARLTGLSPERIRAWEARYRAITPHRSPNGRRTYTDEHLYRLRMLAEATNFGHPISAVAGLPDDELSKAIEASHTDFPHRDKIRIVNSMIGALSNMELDECDARLATAFVNLDAWQLASEVIMPLLAEIDSAVGAGDLRSAQKHLILGLLRARLYATIQRRYGPERDIRLRFATLAGDGHEIDALTACYLASVAGFAGAFMGPNLAASDVVDIATNMPTTILCIGVTEPLADSRAMEALTEVQAGLPDSVKLWIIGARASEVGAILGTDQCVIIESVATLRGEFNKLAMMVP